MDVDKINQAVEDALVATIRDGAFKIDYDKRVDCSHIIKDAYKDLDYAKIISRVKDLIEEYVAQKIVNKMITEMGTDVKSLMSHADIRDEFRNLLRQGVTDILAKVKTGLQVS